MTALKIGILTFHRCINYGSYWQARCLAEGLRARGHQTTILDHASRQINLAEWKCAFRPVLPTPVPKSDYPLYRDKIQRFFRAFDALPLSPPFPIDRPTEMINCDVVVVGSDEVWNLSHPWYGRCPLFYGEGVQAQHLISFAASFGNYSRLNGLHQTWADKLRNFAMISVRDKNSQMILKNAIGIKPKIVLDPCLQFSINPEERVNDNLQERYVAIYGHNFSDSFIHEVRRWAAHKKMPLISIGYRNDWADRQWINAGPHDFAHFIARSTAVATNFFHGCIFSLYNSKPFVCEPSFYRSNKLRDLMTKINGDQHLITEDTPFSAYDAVLSNPLSPAILRRIDALRETSNAFLNQALDLKQFQSV